MNKVYTHQKEGTVDMKKLNNFRGLLFYRNGAQK